MKEKNKIQKKKTSTKELVIQFIKFGLIGGLNTVIDFALLNTFFWATGVYSGSLVILFNIISFTVAVINSYVLNKKWTFNSTKKDVSAQLSKFITISLVGLLINTAIVFVVTSYVKAPFNLSEGLWANGAKIFATVFALVWNFIGYKLWAFAEKK